MLCLNSKNNIRMKVHFVAIGGSVMHNLAIALHNKGFEISGSDDEVFEPAKSNLKKYSLLPEELGWHPEKIDKNIDAIILGMHAKPDNPELLKAQKLGIKIYSYPEFIYEQSKNKKRIVIAGSHGKTTITSMIMHVLKKLDYDYDYLVGAQLEGFETMVKVTNEAPLIIIEGDEYLASPIDRKPKFHFYKPDVAVISGIAWDHINVFPTFENYIAQFEKFIQQISKKGKLFYSKQDEVLNDLIDNVKDKPEAIAYSEHPNEVINHITYLNNNKTPIPVKIFGRHNLQNLQAAKHICIAIGIPENSFYDAIQSFAGAAKRLELLSQSDKSIVYKDFAHAPSKVKATIQALKDQYPERVLVACLELHTYSSLNEKFLEEYKGTMDNANILIIYYDEHALSIKGLPDIDPEMIKKAFNNDKLAVYQDIDELAKYLKNINWTEKNLLLMSSGNFGGINMIKLSEEITNG